MLYVYICMCLCLYVCMCYRTTCDTRFSPCTISVCPGVQTQVSRLGGKHPYPLSQLAIPLTYTLTVSQRLGPICLLWMKKVRKISEEPLDLTPSYTVWPEASSSVLPGMPELGECWGPDFTCVVSHDTWVYAPFALQTVSAFCKCPHVPGVWGKDTCLPQIRWRCLVSTADSVTMAVPSPGPFVSVKVGSSWVLKPSYVTSATFLSSNRFCLPGPLHSTFHFYFRDYY